MMDDTLSLVVDLIVLLVPRDFVEIRYLAVIFICFLVSFAIIFISVASFEINKTRM